MMQSAIAMKQREQLAADKDTAVQRQLAEIREFYEFLDREQAGILERWQQHRNKREAAS
jgi:site-specific recombinase XerD